MREGRGRGGVPQLQYYRAKRHEDHVGELGVRGDKEEGSVE